MSDITHDWTFTSKNGAMPGTPIKKDRHYLPILFLMTAVLHAL